MVEVRKRRTVKRMFRVPEDQFDQVRSIVERENEKGNAITESDVYRTALDVFLSRHYTDRTDQQLISGEAV